MTHWAASVDDLTYFAQTDFVSQIALCLEDEGTPRKDYARRLGVSPGRVSQLLNDPGNLTARNIVKYANAVGKNVAIVLYGDGDHTHDKGPIHGVVFKSCWEKTYMPRDVFALDDIAVTRAFAIPEQNFYRPGAKQETDWFAAYKHTTKEFAATVQPFPDQRDDIGQREEERHAA